MGYLAPRTRSYVDRRKRSDLLGDLLVIWLIRQLESQLAADVGAVRRVSLGENTDEIAQGGD